MDLNLPLLHIIKIMGTFIFPLACIALLFLVMFIQLYTIKEISESRIRTVKLLDIKLDQISDTLSEIHNISHTLHFYLLEKNKNKNKNMGET